MLKASVIALAIAASGAGLVLAQSTTTSPTTDQSTTDQRMKSPPAATATSPTTTNKQWTAATSAPAQMLNRLPEHATVVSNWYDQNVYDPSENKLGEIKDMLLDQSGKVTAVIVSVGGFLGINEKDVAVPFEAVNATRRENKSWLVMNASKDTLKNAPGFKYDRSQGTWTVAAAE